MEGGRSMSEQREPAGWHPMKPDALSMADAISTGLSHNPAAVAFASDCAAYLVGKEMMGSNVHDVTHQEAAAHEAAHAIVMAALGIQPVRVVIFRNGDKFGGRCTPKVARQELTSLHDIGRLMCIALAGHVGETLTGSHRLSGGAHEIGVTFYLAKVVELRHAGVSETASLRATMAECKRILLEYQAQHRKLAGMLLVNGTIEGPALESCLTGIEIVPPDRWRTLVMEGGGSEAFPALEGAQRIAQALAFATQNYAELIPRPGVRKSLAELERHDKAALLFSGGKDSIALAHLLKPYRERLTLLWVNTGMMFPHMAGFIWRFAQTHGYELVELHSDQAKRFSIHGLPSKIIPIFNTRQAMETEEKPQPRMFLANPISCCSELRAKPAIEWMQLNGIRVVIHGQRAQDVGRPQFSDQITEIAPLWDWSEADVYEYIRANSLELPEQYQAGYADSGECWNCTSEVSESRFRWMAKRYPELLVKFVPIFADVCGAVHKQLDDMGPGMTAAARAYKELPEESLNG